jgi:hypothetical protein
MNPLMRFDFTPGLFVRKNKALPNKVEHLTSRTADR